MIWNLTGGWLFMVIAVVAMFSYLLGYFLDKIMMTDGFGVLGNMTVIAAGFVGGLYTYNVLGHLVSDLREGVVVGLIGAFATLTVAALGRAFVIRF